MKVNFYKGGNEAVKVASLLPRETYRVFSSFRRASNSKFYKQDLCLPKCLSLVQGFIASYKVSFLIAKRGLPLNVGKSLGVPAMKKIISTAMERDPAPVLQIVPLSDTRVKRQIDKMGRNIEDQL